MAVLEPMCTRNARGVVTVDWGFALPLPGDTVLMSVDLFCDSIDAINIEASRRRTVTMQLNTLSGRPEFDGLVPE